MSNEDEFKSIRLELDFSDSDGNRTRKMQTVRVNNPSLKDKSKSTYFSHVRSVYTISFTIQIPGIIHSFLAGKSVPSIRSEQTRDYTTDFAKSINRQTIEGLTVAWCEIIEDYIWLKRIEKAELKKVIFFMFENEYGNNRSYWNSTEFGKSAKLKYEYSIGYISEYMGRQIRYNHQKISISSSNDREFYSLKYIEWTAERELFFANIQTSFETIARNITDFESRITEETINGLITNSPLLLNS